jgi:hypothetical protein
MPVLLSIHPAQSMSTMSSRLINVFKTIPKELFRVNNGRSVRLREYGPQRQRSYDILTEAGNVKAKALDPQSYQGKTPSTSSNESLANLEAAPNGASMRPNSLFQRGLVSSLKGKNVVVYSVAAGKSANFLVVN